MRLDEVTEADESATSKGVALENLRSQVAETKRAIRAARLYSARLF